MLNKSAADSKLDTRFFYRSEPASFHQQLPHSGRAAGPRCWRETPAPETLAGPAEQHDRRNALEHAARALIERKHDTGGGRQWHDRRLEGVALVRIEHEPGRIDERLANGFPITRVVNEPRVRDRAISRVRAAHI